VLERWSPDGMSCKTRDASCEMRDARLTHRGSRCINSRSGTRKEPRERMNPALKSVDFARRHKGRAVTRAG